MRNRLEIEFYSHAHCLYHLEHYFCYLLEGVPIHSEIRDRIRLCFYEAVTNAVVHGNLYDENKKVWIDAVCENEKFVITIRDEGEGFCMSTVEDPCKEENLEKPSGRGILFVREHSDECYYDRDERYLQLVWKLENS